MVKSDKAGPCGGTKALEQEIAVECCRYTQIKAWNKKKQQKDTFEATHWSHFEQILIHAHTNASSQWPSHSVSEVKCQCVFTVYSHHLRPLLNAVSASIARLVTHTHTLQPQYTGTHPSWPLIHTPLTQTHTVELNSFSVHLHTQTHRGQHTQTYRQIWAQ